MNPAVTVALATAALVTLTATPAAANIDRNPSCSLSVHDLPDGQVEYRYSGAGAPKTVWIDGQPTTFYAAGTVTAAAVPAIEYPTRGNWQEVAQLRAECGPPATLTASATTPPPTTTTTPAPVTSATTVPDPGVLVPPVLDPLPVAPADPTTTTTATTTVTVELVANPPELPELPATGIDTADMIYAGGLAVLIGLLLVRLAYLRRHTQRTYQDKP